jgi:ABC-type uncharacterized transport system permease subunit
MAYWIITVALIVLGFIAALSIGQPFLMLGLAMLVLSPFRTRPLIFWPPLLVVVAYNLAYFAVAPFSCTASSFNGAPSTTVCSSLIGIQYAGDANYNPSLLPAIAVGLAVAALTGVVSYVVLRARSRGPAPN